MHRLLSQITNRNNNDDEKQEKSPSLNLFCETTDKILEVEKMLTHTERRLETINAKIRKLSFSSLHSSSSSSSSGINSSFDESSTSSIGSPANRTERTTLENNEKQMVKKNRNSKTLSSLSSRKHTTYTKKTTINNKENETGPVKRVSSLKSASTTTTDREKSKQLHNEGNNLRFRTRFRNFLIPLRDYVKIISLRNFQILIFKQSVFTRGVFRASFRKFKIRNKSLSVKNNVSSRTGTVHLKI